MIEYDYLLEKNDGYETKKFTPQFDRSIYNVSTFRGHNSSGKSTFMDLVALTLHGRNSPEVISKLKEKLDYLHDADNSDFIFDLQVDNSNIVLKAKAEKTGHIDGHGEWDCVIQESEDGGKTFNELTKERFLKKYRVIYDMPDRPMERVQELVREAERITSQATDSVDDFRNVLNDELHKAENSRNEELIYFLKAEINNQNEQKADMEEDVEQIRKISKRLNQLYYSTELSNLFAEQADIDSKISNLNNAKNKKEREVKKVNKDYDANVRVIRNHLKKMVDNCRIVCNRLEYVSRINSDVIDRYTLYGSMTPESIFSMNCSQLYSFRKVSKEMISQIESAYKDDEVEGLVGKKNLLGELVTALEPYVSDQMEVLDSPVSSLHEKLSEEYRVICEEVGEYEKVQDVLQHIRNALQAAKLADEKNEDLGERPICESDDSSIATVLNNRREINNKAISSTIEEAIQYQVTADNYGRYYDQCHEDILLREYLSYSMGDLKKKASDMINNVNDRERKIVDLQGRIHDLDRELQEAESKDPHPLSEYKDELSKLNSCVQDMIKDFKGKCGILTTLSTGGIVKESNENCDFLENVWVYLGQRLGTIQHIGNSYMIDKIDMNQRVIISGDIRIMFKDMGTGESQLAYLTGLLNSDDKRMTIALFDEIDHMDPIIISKIQSQLKQLYEGGKLLMGIMAAPGIGTEVVSCE